MHLEIVSPPLRALVRDARRKLIKDSLITTGTWGQEPQGYILRQTQHLDRILLKRQDTIRILVIACTILAALAVLVPMNVPAISPMDVIVTTWRTTFITPIGVQNFTFTFVLANVTTTIFTTSVPTATIFYQVFNTTTVFTTVPVSVTTTVATYVATTTGGTTTVPFTVLSTVTATTTGQTVTLTTSQTATSTSYTTTGVTVISTSTYTKTGVTAPTPPPIPGFPLESILAGLGLGLLGVHLLYRNRRASKEHSA